MGKLLRKQFVLMMVGSTLFVAGWLMGQQTARNENTVVHAVAWTAANNLSPQALQDFESATATFAAGVPGLERAWVGPLRAPLTQGDVTRTHGLIFEFKDMNSREAYSKHPTRDAWLKAFGSIRDGRPVVFDVVGE